MAESALSFSPETGKPDPVSTKEWFSRDGNAQKDFQKTLSWKEKRDFRVALTVAVESMPRNERRELWKIRKEALDRKKDPTIADKVDRAIAAFKEARLLLPEKPKILLRKLRGPNGPFARWAREKTSPFLMK